MQGQPIPVRKGMRIFVLTGAGISAESGIRTFRDANGLWEEHRVEDVATPEGFERDPRLVWRFYSERRLKAARRRARRAQQRSAAAGGQASPARAEQLAAVKPRGEGKRKVRQGVVISDKSEKTIVVRIDVARRHRRYEKIVRTSSVLHAHDEANDARIGDTVIVRECRPLSRLKRWRLVEVVERAE